MSIMAKDLCVELMCVTSNHEYLIGSQIVQDLPQNSLLSVMVSDNARIWMLCHHSQSEDTWYRAPGFIHNGQEA